MNPIVTAAEVAVVGPARVLKLQACLIGASVLIAALFAFYTYHKVIVSSLKSHITELTERNANLTRDNATLKTNVETMSGALDKQNKAVASLAEEQDKMSKVANAAIDKAKKDAVKWKKKYDTLLDSPRPPGDDCAAFNTKLNQYIEVRQQEAAQ